MITMRRTIYDSSILINNHLAMLYTSNGSPINFVHNSFPGVSYQRENMEQLFTAVAGIFTLLGGNQSDQFFFTFSECLFVLHFVDCFVVEFFAFMQSKLNHFLVELNFFFADGDNIFMVCINFCDFRRSNVKRVVYEDRDEFF